MVQDESFVTRGPTKNNPTKNLRKELWKIICQIDEIQHSELISYATKRKEALKKASKLKPEEYQAAQDVWPDLKSAEELYLHFKK